MSQITRIQVEDGLSFLVQIEGDDLEIPSYGGAPSLSELPPGATPTGAVSDIVEATRRTIGAAIALVRKGFVSMVHPDEFSLEFSIALKGSAGTPVIVSQSTEGTFKISVKWKNSNQEDTHE